MPTGIIINTISIAVGGMAGVAIGEKTGDFKEKLNMIFGFCAMGMGISSIVIMKNMPAVKFAIVLGTVFGLVIHLGDKIDNAAGGCRRLLGNS